MAVSTAPAPVPEILSLEYRHQWYKDHSVRYRQVAKEKKVNVDSKDRTRLQTIVGISSQNPNPLAHRCRRCQLPFFADFYRLNHWATQTWILVSRHRPRLF